MNSAAKSEFLKKVLVFLLLFCFLPQVLCSALRYICEYVGPGAFYRAADAFVSVAGTAAVFVSYGVFIFLIFVFGTGFDPLIPSFVAVTLYVFAYVIMLITESFRAGVVMLAVSAVFSSVLFIALMKGSRPHAALTVVFETVPYLAAVVTVATLAGFFGDVLESAVYGLMGLGLDTLLLVITAVLAFYSSRRAASKGENIVVGGSFAAKGRPVLRCAFAVTAAYGAVAVLNMLPATVSEIKDYGMPVSGTEFFETFGPYLLIAAGCAAGYFAAALTVNRLEDLYFEADDKARLADRGRRGK